MCEKFTKKEMVTGELIKFTQCLGNKPLTNDQKAFLWCRWENWSLPQKASTLPRARQNARLHGKSTNCFKPFMECPSQSWNHDGKSILTLPSVSYPHPSLLLIPQIQRGTMGSFVCTCLMFVLPLWDQRLISIKYFPLDFNFCPQVFRQIIYN